MRFMSRHIDGVGRVSMTANRQPTCEKRTVAHSLGRPRPDQERMHSAAKSAAQGDAGAAF
jgi:hypothetical protein